MILPSKIFSYKQSIFPKMILIIKELQSGECGVLDLYKQVRQQFDGVDEYMETLDCLYAIGRVEIDDRRTLKYVERN